MVLFSSSSLDVFSWFLPTGHVVDIYSKFDVIVSLVCLCLLFVSRTLDIELCWCDGVLIRPRVSKASGVSRIDQLECST